MEILFITPEILPYSHSSELGEVCAALPKALRSIGHKVTIISPLWAGVDATARSLARRLSGLEVQLGEERLTCTLFDGRTTGGVELVFVAQQELFGHAAAPDESALGLRAAIGFVQAAAAIAANRSPAPEVVHAHGWFAAAALPLCAQTVPSARRVLSLYDSSTRAPIGAARSLLPAALQELAGGAHGTLLRLGADAAQRVIARSPSAAAVLLEERDPALMPSLEGKLTGIAQGLDAARWNPLTDPLLAARFDAVSAGGKARCKDALQLELALPIRPELPVIACVLGASDALSATLSSALPTVLRSDVQVLLLGDANETVAELRARFADRLAVLPAPDERTLHRVVAGADLLLTTAQCGVGSDLHLAAQRYGTLPIVPGTGPTADAVVDCDASMTTGTGFLFDASNADDLAATMQRTVSSFSQRETFARLQARVMRLDRSWERSARHFEHAYKGSA